MPNGSMGTAEARRGDHREREMRGILDTTAFQSLMRRTWLAPLRKADIDVSELPEGCGIEDAWKALTTVRYAQSFHSPRALRSSIESRDGWHTVPVSLQRTLDEISALTRKGSDLDLRAHERKGRGFITQQYVEEMVCNLSFDGFEVGYEDLRAVILGDRPPLDAAEMLALNFHRIMYGLDEFENAPFDEATLEGLYEKLTEGTQGPLAAADALPRSPLFEHYAMECGRDGCGRPTLRIVVDAATGCASDPPRYPLMNSMLVNCQFWRAALFPSCNNLMGCVASRLYLLQQGHPVFRYVPKIRILEKWRAGGYGDAAAFTFEEALATAEENGDWTPYYDVVMRLMLKEVRSIARSLSVKARVDEDAVAGIDRIPGLAHRQRDVLRSAVLIPDKTFRISSHQKTYGIAYSTARGDLESLADAGLLSRFVDGQAYSYRAAACLRAVLSSREGPRPS